MAAVKETVLYYNSKDPAKSRIVKSVLIRLGIRIRNITSDQVKETIGYLVGLEGFEACSIETGEGVTENDDGSEAEDTKDAFSITEEVMVLHHFSERRLDQLLREMRKMKASVALKAIVTESNCSWSFYELYEELKKERAAMNSASRNGNE